MSAASSQKHLPALAAGRRTVWELPLAGIPGHAPMLLWASLLLFAPVGGQLAAPKPLLSLHPPWTPVFRGDAVTLTCNVSHIRATENRKRYRWNLNGRMLPETAGDTLKARDSGRYWCQTQGSLPSDTVTLIFSSEWLILQAPHLVFEGDTLVLRCQVKGREKLSAVKYSWNGKVVSTPQMGQDLLIPRAGLNNSGSYQCIGFLEGNHYTYRSSVRIIKVQELFPQPRLEVTPPEPAEGGSVNLSCRTQLPLKRSDSVLFFMFFRDHGAMLSNWSRSPELQVPAVWREDSGSYWCEAAARVPSIHKRSLPRQVCVHGIPVSAVLLETEPQGGQVLAGERLVLICSVAEGTGDTTFSWHREDTGESVGSKRQRSQRAELAIAAVAGSHAGRYYCTADNGHGLARSGARNVTVTGTTGSRSGLIAAGATGGLLSILLAAALWIYPRHRWISGGGFPASTGRIPPTAGPGEAPHARCPAPAEWQCLYDNVHPGEGDLVYSEVQLIRLGQEGADRTSRTSLEDKHASVVYSAVKTQLPEDSAGEVRSQEQDAMEGYENVQLA